MQTLDRYELVAELGRGGAGIVYRAHDPRLEREVAIKLLIGGPDAERASKRLAREARALAQLDHPNVVSIRDIGVVQGAPFIVMDLVPGESLQDRLDREGPLPIREAAQLAERLARALQHAHEHQILHRDLKPANVLLDRDGRPRLTDFGLAKALNPDAEGTRISATGGFLGTPGYWPPEQAHGELSQLGPAADVYALGATLYAMLTGAPPYAGKSLIELLGAMDEPPAPPSRLRPEVPPDLERICLRCLQAEIGRRYPTASALAEDLAAFLTGAPLAPAPAPSRAGLALAILGLGLVASGLVLWIGRAPDTPPPAPSATPLPAVRVSPRPPAAAADAQVAEALRVVELGRAEEAIRLADLALELDPEQARAFGVRALAHYVQGGFTNALDDAERALALDPELIPAHTVRAGALLQLGRFADAAAGSPAAERAAARTQTPVPEVFRLAREVADWERANGTPIEELWSRSKRSYDAGDWLATERDLDRILQVVPDYLTALMNRAQVRTRRGDTAGALVDLERVAQITPALPDVWEKLALLASSEGEPRRALRHLERGLQGRPDDLDLVEARAILRGELREWDAALADAERVLAGRPDEPQVLLIRAMARDETGDHQGAIADCTRVIQQVPDSGRAFAVRGRARGALGQLRDGLADCDRALELDSTLCENWIDRASVRAVAHDGPGARRDLQRALQVARDEAQREEIWAILSRLRDADPDDPFTRAARHQKDGEPALAAEAYTEALTLRPDDAELLTGRSAVRSMLLAFPAALEDAERAVTLDPGYAAAHFARATALAFLGRFGEARAEIQTVDSQVTLSEPFTVFQGQIEDALRREAELGTSFLEVTRQAAREQREGNTPRALELLDTALVISPAHPTALLDRAELSARTDPRAALADLNTVVSRYPWLPLVHALRAHVLAGLGRRDEARAARARAEELPAGGFPGATAQVERVLADIELPLAAGADDALARGERHHAAGQLEQALREYERAHELAPRRTDVLLRRAAVQARLRNSRRAVLDAEAVMALDPSEGSAYALRASAWIQLGLYELALSDALRALELDPLEPTAELYRGYALTMLGRYEAAREAFARVGSAPGDEEFQARSMGQFLAAIDASQRREQELGVSFIDAKARALTAGGRGEWNESIAALRQALQIYPNHPVLYLGLAGAYNELDQYAEALECADAMLALQPWLPQAHFVRAAALAGLGRKQEAIGAARRARELCEGLVPRDLRHIDQQAAQLLDRLGAGED